MSTPLRSGIRVVVPPAPVLVALCLWVVGAAPAARAQEGGAPVTSPGATPAEATPSEATPSETTPSETTPSETTPSEATQAEATPSETTPSEPPASARDVAVVTGSAPPSPSALRASRLALTLATGERAYRAQCLACHGIRGDGNGPAARFLDVAPRDFTRGVYKWRTTPSGALPTDRDLARTVRRGVPGTPMASFAGRMPEHEIPAVVQYIKTFSRRFLEEQPARPVAMPSRVPRFDAAAERRGRLMYALMQCWTCHGVRGDGRGPASATLQDDRGRPIEAYDFTGGRFRSGGRPFDVFRTFTTGVDGTPMPAYEDVLLVGSDAFPDLSPLRPAVGARGLTELRAFLTAMPTTEAIAELPDHERQQRAAALRWDLVAYVLSLSRGSRVLRYLASPFYVTE